MQIIRKTALKRVLKHKAESLNIRTQIPDYLVCVGQMREKWKRMYVEQKHGTYSQLLKLFLRLNLSMSKVPLRTSK